MIRPAWGRYSCKHWYIHCNLVAQNCVGLNVPVAGSIFQDSKKRNLTLNKLDLGTSVSQIMLALGDS